MEKGIRSISLRFLLPALAVFLALPLVVSWSDTDNAQEPLLAGIEAGICKAQLPVGSVERHTVADARGVALLIPQIHRNPGSELGDPINARAVTTQTQMKDIIRHLTETQGMSLVMTEGDLYGEVSDEKLGGLKRKMKARDEFAEHVALLKSRPNSQSVNPSLERSFVDGAEKFLATVDDELILAGAAHILKAEGGSFALVGAENAGTREESTRIVRNYLYLKDRLSQVAPVSSRIKGLGASFSPALESLITEKSKKKDGKGSEVRQKGLNENLLRMAAGQKERSAKAKNSNIVPPLEFSLDALGKLAMLRGDAELKTWVDETHEAFSVLSQPTEEGREDKAPAPKRSENPYRTISDPRKLEDLLEESERQIQEVIIDQRNREAAANFADALGRGRVSAGVLVYGAGHTEGLVSELNKKGLSVLVISPAELLNDAEGKTNIGDGPCAPGASPIRSFDEMES